jgi:hypothetical protein
MTGWVLRCFPSTDGVSGGLREPDLADTSLQLIFEIKASGLRGRGGAGFPSGLKYVSGMEPTTQPFKGSKQNVLWGQLANQGFVSLIIVAHEL